jgi:hypothetical protein
MPIKGMTDNESRRPGASLKVIGRLYKGGERTEEDIARRRPGKDLNYFRVVFEPGYEDLQPIWEEMYGANPTAIDDVYLLAATVNDAFPTFMEEWSKTGLIRRCDRETQLKWFEPAVGYCVTTPRPCAANCGCKAVGRLKFLLPEFVIRAGAPGMFMLTTHSQYDITHVDALLYDIQVQRGSLTGVPFVLTRKPKDIPIPEVKGGQPTGNRIKITKSLLHLQVEPQFMKAEILPALANGSLNELPLPDAAPSGRYARESDYDPEDEAKPSLPAPDAFGDETEWTDAPGAQPAGAAFQTYYCDRLTLNKLKRSPNSYQYVLHCDGGTNIVMFTGDKLREAGFPVDTWKADGDGAREFEPVIAVEARLVGDGSQAKWEVNRVHDIADVPF